MRKYFLVSFLLLLFSDVFANHISGGEMIYEYLGPGSSANTKKYRITLKLFRDNNGGGAAMPGNVYIGIFNNDNNVQFGGYYSVNISSTGNVPVADPPLCMTNPPNLNYSVGVFSFTVDLPNNANGYTAAYQTCCRIFPLQNVYTLNQPAQGEGSTYSCKIPGTNQLPVGNNSSPQFSTQLAPVCHGNSFIFDFSAYDPDGDSLVYYYCDAFNRGEATSSTNVNPSSPPFVSVGYINGYSGSNPLGYKAVLDTKTGIISGIAPATEGKYVVCVCINEFRNGVLIGNHRKDFILNVADCDLAKATLPKEYPLCDGFTKTFSNGSNSPAIQTYDWDFGDGNTSTQPDPTHTYADTGIYTLKLVVNKGLPCTDSAAAIVKVFPGFHPDFEVLGQCKNTAIQFRDKTVADFGNVNLWNWNFGDFASTNNTATTKNATHIYPDARNYDVTFIVASDKGCIDTLTRTITITDKPTLTKSNDTLICSVDTLQLFAFGAGSFTWSPNYNISNTNVPDPFVSPDVTTVYHVTISDPFGCTGTDSVKVGVVNFVTQSAPPDTTICKTDAIVLRLTSDALYYQWTEIPAGNTLSNPNIKNPVAIPVTNTRYHVVSSIGKCRAQSDIVIKVVPYPAANAGPDQTICVGKSAQLNAGGGSSYSWSPAAFLNDRTIPNPVSISPTASIKYVVTVTDVLGCPKPSRDTVIVIVDRITANVGPRDTSVVINQPLQLQATGSVNYLWSPATWLNNIVVSNPVALPQNDIEYVVKVSNNFGCFDYDSIRVHVFKVEAGLYVPNAFTPNGDGKNDLFRPITLGMKSLDVFKVYNRWGQMMYSGTDMNSGGWDGTFAGKGQDPATYVWYAEGTDYNNRKIKKKGYVVLIR